MALPRTYRFFVSDLDTIVRPLVRRKSLAAPPVEECQRSSTFPAPATPQDKHAGEKGYGSQATNDGRRNPRLDDGLSSGAACDVMAPEGCRIGVFSAGGAGDEVVAMTTLLADTGSSVGAE
ncbi:hypothetical protein SCAR479_08537 [Seiridium cardinale]|uniref:Uncharacterized protein n=1 Tax=Seiridium cardinale TaxID=138064 RepID=A0ABR2XLM4_9PEZI